MSVNGNQAGGLVSAFSSLTSAFSNANAQSSADTFKANQLQLSSQASNLQAQSILQTGEQNQGLVGIKAKQQIGQSKANFGGQGVVTSTGSAAVVQSSEAGQAALSEETIKSNAWREAWGLQVNASNEASGCRSSLPPP